jgi:hypothetical protein
VRKVVNLLPSSADVTESGSLNLPEPSGPHRPVMGLIYLMEFSLATCISVGTVPQCAVHVLRRVHIGYKDFV